MRVLVTGGAGFIGSNFVRRLLREEHRVTTLDALTYAGNRAKLEDVLDHSNHEFVEGDVRNDELVAGLLDDVNAVVNFAAESHVDRSIEGSDEFVSTNVGGTQTLLDAAVDANLDRFVQISTDEVYGEVIDGEFTETDRLDPQNPYAATKASADLLCSSYHETHGIPVSVVRPSNNFGPRQNTEKFIPKFITRAIDGEPLPLYGDGTHVREWTYVADNCRAIELVLCEGTAGEVYNVGSGVELQNQDVAEQITELVGQSTDLIERVEDRPGHDRRYALDTSKIESLGWEPKWSFREALEATVDYYRSDE